MPLIIVVQFYARKIGREHSTCCGRNLCLGVLFHHDLLVPLGSGWGSGSCLPSSLFFLSSGQGFYSIMICWLLLVRAGVPVLVSLLLSSSFSQEMGSVPS